METIYTIFGQAGDLTAYQMAARGVLVFIFAVIILRSAGKKTFGKRSPADNVIMIMLGAILSRAVVGSSPFIPVIVASFAIVLFHRLFVWISLYSTSFSIFIKGNKISLFKDGQENSGNMKVTMMSKEDLMEAVRLQTNSESLDNIQEIFIEKNGQVSIMMKSPE